MPSKHDRYKSKYTVDRQIPGAFEGETITRRRFMTGTAGAVAAASFTLPALGLALAPVFEREPHRWEIAGPVDMFSDDNYVPVVITVQPGIGQVGKTTVYVRKHNAALDTDAYDRDPVAHPFIALSDRCAHAGCPVRWVPAAERFACPSNAFQDSAMTEALNDATLKQRIRYVIQIRAIRPNSASGTSQPAWSPSPLPKSRTGLGLLPKGIGLR